MNAKKFSLILAFFVTAWCGTCRAEPDIYVFTDFGGGKHEKPISDWQTAIELAGEGGKLTHHPEIFINDGASPLDPIKAGKQLAQAFPYLGAHSTEKIQRIVIHVIDPGVGNASQHPRALVLRKDGTLFIGPDNGTLSLACPVDSIAKIWEINTKKICVLTGIDLEAGGTFHGRDVFAAAAFLLAANQVTPDEIGKAYPQKELKFRSAETASNAILFQDVNTSRFNLTIDKAASEDELFSQSYFLAIVQSPVYAEEAPQLFFVEDGKESGVAKDLLIDRSFANVPPGIGFIYVGSSGAAGPNPIAQDDTLSFRAMAAKESLAQTCS